MRLRIRADQCRAYSNWMLAVILHGIYFWQGKITEFLPEIVYSVETNYSHTEYPNPFNTVVSDHFAKIYLHTHPIDTPVVASQIHHQGENSSLR